MTNLSAPILIVEDIPYVLDMLEVTLKYKGYEVIKAHDGDEALSIITSEPVSLILTDILMPKLDGFTLAHKVRRNPATQDIPIIFISATYITEEDKAFAMELGAARFIEKPIEAQELLLTIAEVLTEDPQPKQRAISNQDFYRGYRARLRAKLAHKEDQIRRARRLVETVSEGQRAMFEALLVQTEVQRSEIETELQLLDNLIRRQED